MNNPPKVLVIGYGSIGKRHKSVLNDLGCEVAVVCRRPDTTDMQFSNTQEALGVYEPDYVVIASRTSEHLNDMTQLALCEYTGKLLIEKPIFDSVLPLGKCNFKLGRVAFNIRCHILYQVLLDELFGQRILSVHGYVGQYLPDWRPTQDYRLSYSASAKQGGGVLLDLSHDVDIMGQLIGPWHHLTALGGQISALEITSDDCFSILMTSAKCPSATLSLNYLDRYPRREYIVNCEGYTLHADFIAGTLRRDKTIVFQSQPGLNDTYKIMHERMLTGDGNGLCTFENGLEVLKTIEKCRRAAATKTWVTNE